MMIVVMMVSYGLLKSKHSLWQNFVSQVDGSLEDLTIWGKNEILPVSCKTKWNFWKLCMTIEFYYIPIWISTLIQHVMCAFCIVSFFFCLRRLLVFRLTGPLINNQHISKSQREKRVWVNHTIPSLCIDQFWKQPFLYIFKASSTFLTYHISGGFYSSSSSILEVSTF